MSSTSIYLEHADACRDVAAGLSPREQAILLKIAGEWQRAAIESADHAPPPTVWPSACVYCAGDPVLRR